MSIKNLNPYLFFNGDAAKAIELYQRALGAQVENVMHYGDVPGSPSPSPSPDKNRVIHAMLRLPGGVLMISDASTDDPTRVGNNVTVCLDIDDPADMAAKFDALAAGGKVGVAIHDTFWGAKFGILTDAFGITWLFNCQIDKA